MRKMDGWDKAQFVIVIFVILVGWGIISALDHRPVKAFLTLLVVMGGPFFFLFVVARHPDTRLGKVFQEILTFLAMFGGGPRG